MDVLDISGVGKVLAEKLNNNGIFTTSELINTLPKAYTAYKVDNSLLYSGTYTVARGIICSKVAIIFGKGKGNPLIFYTSINGDRIKCIAFNMEYLRFKLLMNMNILLYGKYSIDNNAFVISTVFFNDFEEKIAVDYKLKDIKNSQISNILAKLFIKMTLNEEESLPYELIEKYKLYDINTYIYASHFPKSSYDYKQIIRRKKYEELFYYSFGLSYLALLVGEERKKPKKVAFSFISDFKETLAFPLTIDQENAINDVIADSKAELVMNRLVEGDVGCGKTTVALAAALLNIKEGFQVCVLTPTEILAKQTYDTFFNYFKSYRVELLTGSSLKSKKNKIYNDIKNNTTNIIIGTHALFNDDISFDKLGLIIIDEQHKFGVNQRAQLIEKYKESDRLFMSATPIPRTLGLASFADLKISTIKTMPEGRLPIKTEVINEEYLDELIKILNHHLELKAQIYIVCPMVDSDGDYYNVNNTYLYLKDKLNGVIGIAHGKQNSQKRLDAMNDFTLGKIDVLIATTVIEVGVNVPSSTVMVVMSAERFGLATLHQLRGRVGRGNKQSYCFLVTKDMYCKRLEILAQNSSGFDIANMDFMLRGPGDYFGESQSGYLNLDYADFTNDLKIWSYAKEDGKIFASYFKRGIWSSPKAISLISKIKEQSNKIN